MAPIFFGLVCAVSSALLAVVTRILMRRGIDVWVVSLAELLIGGLVLVPLVDVGAAVRGVVLDPLTGIILLAATSGWAAMTFFDTRSYGDLSAGVNALLNALRLVVLVLIGRFCFGEGVPFVGLIGALCIVSGIVVGVEWGDIIGSRGARDRAIAVIAGAIAITLDKALTQRIPIDAVLLAGFFLPGIALILLRPATIGAAVREFPRAGALVCLAGVLTGVMGWTLVHGFAEGELWSTLTLRHTDIVFTFLIGAVVLGERENLHRRGLAAVICTVGAALVTWSKGWDRSEGEGPRLAPSHEASEHIVCGAPYECTAKPRSWAS